MVCRTLPSCCSSSLCACRRTAPSRLSLGIRAYTRLQSIASAARRKVDRRMPPLASLFSIALTVAPVTPIRSARSAAGIPKASRIARIHPRCGGAYAETDPRELNLRSSASRASRALSEVVIRDFSLYLPRLHRYYSLYSYVVNSDSYLYFFTFARTRLSSRA